LTLVEKYKKVKRRFDPQSRIDKKGMGLDPVIDFNMRLGEGTGAALITNTFAKKNYWLQRKWKL
jgi:hypothetical protein